MNEAEDSASSVLTMAGPSLCCGCTRITQEGALLPCVCACCSDCALSTWVLLRCATDRSLSRHRIVADVRHYCSAQRLLRNDVFVFHHTSTIDASIGCIDLVCLLDVRSGSRSGMCILAAGCTG